jgi:hypothetical protein
MGKNKKKNKNKNNKANRSNKKNQTPQTSGVTTPAQLKTHDGTAEDPQPSSMTSYGPNVEAQQDSQSKKHPESSVQHQRRRHYWWQRIQPCEWWPCRSYRWTRDFVVAFWRGLFTRYWIDQLYALVLLVIFLIASWGAVEGLLQMFQPVAALDVNCSVVYVTIPGPIITVSLVGATPTDPNHGTYYYSVINGTTQWLNSIAPPTRFSTLVTSTAVATTTSQPGLSSSLPPLPSQTSVATPSSGPASAPNLSGYVAPTRGESWIQHRPAYNMMH